MSFKYRLVCTVLIFWAIFLPDSLKAQQTHEGNIEAAVSAGFSAGVGGVDRFTDLPSLIVDLQKLSGGTVTFDPGSNAKWNMGVSGGYEITPNIVAIGEIAKTRLVNPTLTLSTLSTPLEFKAGLLETSGGIQYKIPLRNSMVAPFVGVAIGAARTSVSLKNSPFDVLDVNFSNYHFTENFGGGARIYFSKRWGVRPEMKIVHITHETWVRFTGGVFVQFNK